MHATLAEFFATRESGGCRLFPGPRGGMTVLVPSHIWWTDCIAHALHTMGLGVLVTFPFTHLHAPAHAAQAPAAFEFLTRLIRDNDVRLIVAGNSAGMAHRPGSDTLLHEDAGAPMVAWWWDEPRADAPVRSGGMGAGEYLALLRRPSLLHAFWDIDVMEEMVSLFGVDGAVHAPLATTPTMWPMLGGPMAERTVAATFLGNCFAEPAGWASGLDPGTLTRVRSVVAAKEADVALPMIDCVRGLGGEEARCFGSGPSSSAADAERAFTHWAALGSVWRERMRYARVRALAERLGPRFEIIGAGWEKIGLHAVADHSGIPGSSKHYARARASVNLFGGSVHGGMPLRPYEIACSGGLIFTQATRELPALFEPGRECVAFRDNAEMLAALDRVLEAPHEYDAVVNAGRERAIAEHTWERRLGPMLDAAAERFGLPWDGSRGGAR